MKDTEKELIYLHEKNNDGAKFYDTEALQEKVILIGIETDNKLYDTSSCLDELEELAKTAGAETVGRMIQKREGIHRGHYFGKGKLEELKNYIAETGATGIICDDELTANQMRTMGEILETKIMNRTLLILDIFAAHAHSAEGKVQVELAQLKYNRSHLTGRGQAMSRLGGGIGTRGPGEKKLETDRRNIDNRISELNNELKEIEKHRQILRERRIKNKIPVVALVGYTNAGKSTLMNTLTNAGVLAENKLFATLDTTTRKLSLSSGSECLFTDTVGFIQKLPHHLIKSFKATLEESKYADILIHVVDASNSRRETQMKVVYETFKELGCIDKPTITVFNKTDKDIDRPLPSDSFAEKVLSLSAKNAIGTDELLLAIEEMIKNFKKEIKVIIPYDKGNILNMIYNSCEIVKTEHLETGIYIEGFADEEMQNRTKQFSTENSK